MDSRWKQISHNNGEHLILIQPLINFGLKTVNLKYNFIKKNEIGYCPLNNLTICFLQREVIIIILSVTVGIH